MDDNAIKRMRKRKEPEVYVAPKAGTITVFDMGRNQKFENVQVYRTHAGNLAFSWGIAYGVTVHVIKQDGEIIKLERTMGGPSHWAHAGNMEGDMAILTG